LVDLLLHLLRFLYMGLVLLAVQGGALLARLNLGLLVL
jgi:hypothetical protein